jgi:hypothetical protein
MDDGADYMILRMDVIYALAHGLTHTDIVGAFLLCQTSREFQDMLEELAHPDRVRGDE